MRGGLRARMNLTFARRKNARGGLLVGTYQSMRFRPSSRSLVGTSSQPLKHGKIWLQTSRARRAKCRSGSKTSASVQSIHRPRQLEPCMGQMVQRSTLIGAAILGTIIGAATLGMAEQPHFLKKHRAARALLQQSVIWRLCLSVNLASPARVRLCCKA